jgi:uncharacterized protein
VRLLAIGVSARALAQAITAAGHQPVAVDAFGDRDLVEGCDCRSLAAAGLLYSAENLVELARELAPCDGVILAGGMENAPRAVSALARSLRLAGNPPDVLARVREWARVAEAARAAGFTVPDGLPDGAVAPAEADGRWLQKPLHGGGGLGIRAATPGAPCAPGRRLERFVHGNCGSALFLAAGARGAYLLHITEQLTEMDELTAPGFAYRGNILRNDVAPGAAGRVAELCSWLAEAFGLVGCNGIDFIWQGEEPVLLEVNPRWVASAELWEQAAGIPLVAWHLKACWEGWLPAAPPVLHGCYGKAILYGDRDGVWRFDGDWRAAGLCDVPFPGTPVARGRPVCTVLAAGPTPEAVRRHLAERAANVRREWIG